MRTFTLVSMITVMSLLAGCAAGGDKAAAPECNKCEKPAAENPDGWQPLFDGKTLGNWKPTEFGDQGEVAVKDGVLHLPIGNDMTGITWQGDAPARINYEIELVAMKVDGNDFFTGLTFPVGEDYLSLIVGGWGGGLVGISSFNGMDASENDTSSWRKFEAKKWYTIRLRVTKEQVETWIDGEEVIDKALEANQLGTRIEVELSKPLGIATWRTHGAFKSIRWRPVDGPADPDSNGF